MRNGNEKRGREEKTAVTRGREKEEGEGGNGKMPVEFVRAE